MTMLRYPVYKPWLGGNLRKYVDECINTGWISSRGPFIERFEAEFSKHIGSKSAISVANGTVALHLALLSLGTKPGDEIIVPTYTYVASVNAILYCGAKPVFVDSLSDTLQMDPRSIAEKITGITKAVMAVHIYGHPCEMDSILEVCKKHDILLVEDAAEGFGSYWRNKHVGTFGDAATFSFFGNKTITTGEGGMVVVKDPAIDAVCRRLKSQGISNTKEYWHDILGFNYRMTNIQAAIGLSQLEMAGLILERKRNIAEAYARELLGLPLRTHLPVGPVVHSNWMCSIILDKSEDRDPLRARLARDGIETRPFFPPAHRFPYLSMGGRYPVAEAVSGAGINLPSYPELEANDVCEISRSIRRYFLG